MTIDYRDREVLSALEEGLPLVSRPYDVIGQRVGMSEKQVIDRLRKLLADGIVKRFGAVVRHRELGFVANAMVVWDIDDDHVFDVARQMAEFSFVTLCYRRPRRLPDWPYNLFCMIHGRQREAVLEQVAELRNALDIPDNRHAVLFSRRQFKQRGACYAESQNRSKEVA